jgi:hypothetical protein
MLGRNVLTGQELAEVEPVVEHRGIMADWRR